MFCSCNRNSSSSRVKHITRNVVRPNPNAVRIVCDQLKEIPKKLRKQYSPCVTEGFKYHFNEISFWAKLRIFSRFQLDLCSAAQTMGIEFRSYHECCIIILS